jgi:hypothetical protein
MCTEVFPQRFTRKTSISTIQSGLLINSYIGLKNNCERSSQWQCYSSNYYHCFGETCFHCLQGTTQSYLLAHHIHTPWFSHLTLLHHTLKNINHCRLKRIPLSIKLCIYSNYGCKWVSWLRTRKYIMFCYTFALTFLI